MTEIMPAADFVRLFQTRAALAGHFAGAVGGNAGPLTLAALDRVLPRADGPPTLPWITEAKAVFGWHESRDNARLRAWLRRDRATLGDPDAMPWCGDFVETCIKLALPEETLPGDLGRNPYWALNWGLLGMACEPSFGAVATFVRPGGGHVGFLVGEDATHVHVLGGNQGDTVNVARLDKSRLRATRWPRTTTAKPTPLPQLAAGDVPTSTNEF